MPDAFFRIPTTHGGPCWRTAASLAVATACTACVAQLYLLLSSLLVQRITNNAHSTAELHAVFTVGNAACRVVYIALSVLLARQSLVPHVALHAACHVLVAYMDTPWITTTVWCACAGGAALHGAVRTAHSSRDNARAMRKALALYAGMLAVLVVTWGAMLARVLRIAFAPYAERTAADSAQTVAHVILVTAAMGQCVYRPSPR